MTDHVKRFIEDNISMIEDCNYIDLYSFADEQLSDESIKELTNILKIVEPDVEEYAKTSLKYNFAHAFVNEFLPGKPPIVVMSTFVRQFMNTLNGVSYKEFVNIAKEWLEAHPKYNYEIVIHNHYAYLRTVEK